MLYCVMQWSILAFIYFVFLSFALFHANIKHVTKSAASYLSFSTCGTLIMPLLKCSTPSACIALSASDTLRRLVPSSCARRVIFIRITLEPIGERQRSLRNVAMRARSSVGIGCQSLRSAFCAIADTMLSILIRKMINSSEICIRSLWHISTVSLSSTDVNVRV